jgi:carbonic anhydrase/acetyltransferase-like protein (isoleucine patch superfamily)
VIGDVEIGAESSVWYHCVLRGDTNIMRIGARTNIQDGSILHLNAGAEPLIIGDDVTIGHALHHPRPAPCATAPSSAWAATVLDPRGDRGEGGMLGAGGVLTPASASGPNELWSGNPARLVRVMDAEERARFDRTARHYVELAKRHRASLVGGQ